MSLEQGDETSPETPPSTLEPRAAGLEPPATTIAARVVALLEVLLCSDYPTQLALVATFAALGYHAVGANGQLSIGFIAALSLIDTTLLVGLMLFFLYAHGERPRDIFFGARPPGQEFLAGLPLIFAALGIAVVFMATIQWLAPSLHNVENNPLEELVRRPRDAWIFAFVVIVAGGVREELQRAFLLHRFGQWLGGPTVGIVVASLAFGAGHALQGADAAVTTGALGAFWGLVYLRRRSVIAPMVSHAGFDLAQIARFLLAGR